jgi:hypothetical protein
MAQTDDDPSTPAQRDPQALFEEYQTSNDPVRRRRLLRAILDCGRPARGAAIWLLLNEVRALVAELYRSVETAEQLMLDHAHNGGFLQWSCHLPDKPFNSDGRPQHRPLDPRGWGISVPSFGMYSLVDWENSSVSNIHLEVSPYSFEGVVIEKLAEGGYGPNGSCCRNELVCLPLHDVLAMLDRHGLLPPARSVPVLKLEALDAGDTAAVSGTVSAPKNVSAADLEQCFRAIVQERLDDPPLEKWMLEEVDRRLGAHVVRDRVRELWTTIASEWRRPRGIKSHPRS